MDPKEHPKPEEAIKKPEADAPTAPANDAADLEAEFPGSPSIPDALNEELVDKIKDNPNKLIGCGG